MLGGLSPSVGSGFIDLYICLYMYNFKHTDLNESLIDYPYLSVMLRNLKHGVSLIITTLIQNIYNSV